MLFEHVFFSCFSKQDCSLMLYHECFPCALYTKTQH